MTIDQLNMLEKLAASLFNSDNLTGFAFRQYENFHMSYQGKVVAKERQRSGHGHHYTPKETRDFEAKLKKLAREQMAALRLTRFIRPCTVHLEVIDEVPADWPWWMKKLAAQGHCVYDMTGGDLDNREKAILDAFNKVVYRDDRQIVQCYKFRRYGDVTGFKVTITQVGLTKGDLANLASFIERYENGRTKASER